MHDWIDKQQRTKVSRGEKAVSKHIPLFYMMIPNFEPSRNIREEGKYYCREKD